MFWEHSSLSKHLQAFSGEATGWTGLIRVDNTTYTWMGNPNPLPNVATQTSFAYTSTRSIFEFDVGGKVSLKVRFTSPITPDDLLRQSAPVSYMGLEITSKDGSEHDVQVYTDVTAGKAFESHPKSFQASKLTFLRMGIWRSHATS